MHDQARELIERTHIEPQLALIAKHRLPFSVVTDGSSAKCDGGRDNQLTFVHHPLLSKPVAAGAAMLTRSPDSERLRIAILETLARFLSGDTINLALSGLASDNAPVMEKTARESEITRYPDPPHGLALMIKAALKALKLLELLALVKSVLVRKMSLLNRAMMTAFRVPMSVLEQAPTRWALTSRVLRYLSVDENIAAIQQVLLYLLEDELNIAESDDEDDTPVAKAGAKKKRAAKTKELLAQLTDPAVILRIRVATILIAPMRTACAKLQSSAFTPTIAVTLEDVFNRVASTLDTATRCAVYAGARASLTQAVAGTAPIARTCVVDVGGDGSLTVTSMPTLPSYVRLTAGEADEAWVAAVAGRGVSKGVKAVTADAFEAANAAGVAFNDFVAPARTLAEQSRCAHLDGFETAPFSDMLEMKEALPTTKTTNLIDTGADNSAAFDNPFPWNPRRSATEARAAGSGGDSDSSGGVPACLAPTGTKAVLLLEWKDFLLYSATSGDPRAVTAADRLAPGHFWLRMRRYWRLLPELMLYWLSIPVSTSIVEAAFSFQTLIDQNTRRRRSTVLHHTDALMAYIYRDVLEDTIKRTLGL